MRKRVDTSSAIILGLLGIAALLLALAPTPAAAGACDGVTLVDSDQDGFWDCNEQYNLVTPCGQTVVPPLVPSKKDLFVFLVRAAGTNMPPFGQLGYFDPFKLAKDSLAGLVNIHVIESPCTQLLNDRIVSSSPLQKAVKITEDLSTTVNEVGSSTPGIPLGPDEAKIYTNRIWDKLVAACPCIVNDCQTCTDKEVNVKGLDLYPLYIQNTIAHELGHLVRPLHYPYSTKYENHYQEGSYLIMERAIVATTSRKTGIVTIPISKEYGSTDVNNVKLLP